MNYELETDYCEPETCHQLKTNEKCVVFFFFCFFFFNDAVEPLSKKRTRTLWSWAICGCRISAQSEAEAPVWDETNVPSESEAGPAELPAAALRLWPARGMKEC